MIRKFFTFLLVVGLIAFCIGNYMQIQQLKHENDLLAATNAQLLNRLNSVRAHGGHIVHTAKSQPLPDPSEDAQIHLSKAEAAIAKGNIGDALGECKSAAGDLQEASGSTSASVRNSVGSMKAKLTTIEQQTGSLWRKLGV